MIVSPARQAYLDWVRGVAVLVMIEAHLLDSWTSVAERTRPLFGYAMVLGGFGAPMFLFLAGIGVVLSAESKHRRTGAFVQSWRIAEKRGWQIFALAFLFRLQSYVLGGFQNAVGLLKVDILNIMGPVMAMTAIFGRTVTGKAARASLFACVALAIALLTPLVRTTSWLNWLPDPIEWYFRPTPGRTNFTLFPWAGFLFAGAATGEFLDAGAARASMSSFHRRLAAAGAGLAAAAYAASFLPSIYERSEFWTSSPTFFLLRVGLLLLTLPIGYLWVHAPLRHKFSAWSPLVELGRASLFVYWVHVEMVYGVFSRPLRRSLTLESALAAYVLFTVFLLALVLLKNRLAQERALYLTDSKSVI